MGAVQQGQARVRGDEQGHADDAQGLAALLAVVALRQLAAMVEGTDVGEEVGSVEEDPAQVGLDGGGDVGGDAVHVIPEALGGELGGANGRQAGQGGGVEPAGEGGLGAGGLWLACGPSTSRWRWALLCLKCAGSVAGRSIRVRLCLSVCLASGSRRNRTGPVPPKTGEWFALPWPRFESRGGRKTYDA